jgi:hypothetical protein
MPKFSFASLPPQPVGEPVEVFIGAPKPAARLASGAAPGAKPVKPVQTAGNAKPGEIKAGSAPAVWTSLTPTPVAHAASPAMSTVLSETPATVPLPRPRPAIKPKPEAVKRTQPPA